jgi:hypothetical protein
VDVHVGIEVARLHADVGVDKIVLVEVLYSLRQLVDEPLGNVLWDLALAVCEVLPQAEFIIICNLD